MTRCAGYWRAESTQAGWTPCRGMAAQGRFCAEHAEAIQGALLGLVVVENAAFTASQIWFGKETAAVRKRQRKKRLREKRG